MVVCKLGSKSAVVSHTGRKSMHVTSLGKVLDGGLRGGMVLFAELSCKAGVFMVVLLNWV
jgi:hypothetical protein